MKNITFLLTSLLVFDVLAPTVAVAWGPLGHGVIGKQAAAQLDAPTREAVGRILDVEPGAGMDAEIERACFWPDTIREQAGWEWSAPLHYVNLPHHAVRYDRQRDCPEGLCVTEGILKYAAILARPQLDNRRRWEAFAWLCHLVADVHQPLHAGFRDDRGGNLFDVTYRGKTYNLHRFWDSVLAEDRFPGSGSIPGTTEIQQPGAWNRADVVTWTEETHVLAEIKAYPPQTEISEDFADSSWQLIQLQWRRAATRLATVLEAVLGNTGNPEKPGSE